MGYNQEAYAECARSREGAGNGFMQIDSPGRVTIFTGAQSAIRRMASEQCSA